MENLVEALATTSPVDIINDRVLLEAFQSLLRRGNPASSWQIIPAEHRLLITKGPVLSSGPVQESQLKEKAELWLSHTKLDAKSTDKLSKIVSSVIAIDEPDQITVEDFFAEVLPSNQMPTPRASHAELWRRLQKLFLVHEVECCQGKQSDVFIKIAGRRRKNPAAIDSEYRRGIKYLEAMVHLGPGILMTLGKKVSKLWDTLSPKEVGQFRLLSSFLNLRARTERFDGIIVDLFHAGLKKYGSPASPGSGTLTSLMMSYQLAPPSVETLSSAALTDLRDTIAFIGDPASRSGHLSEGTPQISDVLKRPADISESIRVKRIRRDLEGKSECLSSPPGIDTRASGSFDGPASLPVAPASPVESAYKDLCDGMRDIVGNSEPASPGVDVRIISTRNQMSEALRNDIRIPLLIPSGSDMGLAIYNPEGPNTLTYDERLQTIFLDDSVEVDVQDTKRSTISEMTCRLPGRDMLQRMRNQNPRLGFPFNCLELHNREPRTQSPISFAGGSIDILRRLQDEEPEFYGRPATKTRVDKKLISWVLVSEKGALSSPHSDIPVGTFLTCEFGCKYVYYLVRLEGEEAREDSSRKWARVKLMPGDTLVFSTGTIHAVHSDANSIFSGGHFLTPATMAQSIKNLRVLEKHPELTNDELPVDIHKIHLCFIKALCGPKVYDITNGQVLEYINALEAYKRTRFIQQASPEHSKRKTAFKRGIQQDLERLVQQQKQGKFARVID